MRLWMSGKDATGSHLSGVCAAVALSFSASACARNDAPRESAPPAAAPLAARSVAPEPALAARVGLQRGAPPAVTPSAWKAGGKCNIEALDGAAFDGPPLVLKKGAHARIAGWALDPEGTVTPDVVHLRFSSPTAGEFYGTASKRSVRDDVNRTYPVRAKASAESGFELAFGTDELPAGSYALTTVMQIGSEVFICDNGRKVTRVP